MTNKNIKLGFVKSKAFGLCGVILTAVLLAIMAPSAYADEVTNTQPATETVAPVTEPVISAQPETVASATETPATEATANASEETPTVEKAPTEVSKEGTTITVKNPDVDMHFEKSADGNGTGKYVNFKVEYKNIDFPDSMTINEGDQVVFTMPKEVSFRTDFDFDVKNPENQTIGHAQASVEKGTVTTTFNNYFAEHPLKKQMAMTFDAKWTEAVTSGELAQPNFDGTVKKVMIDPEPELDPGTEKFSKWGSQAEEDAQTLKWTIRFNLAKDKLENIVLKDRWTANQTYVDGSLEIRTVDDVKTWSGDVAAPEYLEAFHVMNGGFDLKLKTLQKLVYINYRTKLTTPVKESTDPVNAVWLTANDNEKLADNYRARIALVGGKGVASGENEEIPTPEPGNPNNNNEKPKEEPKEDPKNEETPKKENPKETPKDEPKKDEPKKDEPKKDEPKKDEPKKDEPKKDEPKKDEPKTHNTVQAAQPRGKQLPNTGTSASALGILGFIIGLFAAGLRKKAE